ncbi:uncharacterized, partial [Tachysurus ichikawai]
MQEDGIHRKGRKQKPSVRPGHTRISLSRSRHPGLSSRAGLFLGVRLVAQQGVNLTHCLRSHLRENLQENRAE